MKERNPGRLLLSIGLTAFALLGAATLSFSAAAATTAVAQHSGHCLDVRGGPQATQDGARIEQWRCTGATNQNWALQDMGSGRIRLVAQNSGKCVQNIGGGTTNGTGLEQMTCNGSSGQLWTREFNAIPGVYSLKHVDSTRCLDVPTSSMLEGELLVLFTCSGNANQSWAISETEYPPPAMPLVVVHSGKCLDVRGGPQATQDGAPIEQWRCTGTTNQSWTMQNAGSGQIRLIAQNSGKCVQPIGGGTANSTGLEQRTCDSTAAAQLWTRQALATVGQYHFVHVQSNRCLDIQQSEQADGALALLFDCKTTANQSWTIGAPAVPAVQVLSGEYWTLPSRYPAKSPYGGLNQIWGRAIRNPFSPTTDLHWVGAYWRDLNPSEGTYRWDRLESTTGTFTYSLNELGAAGKSALIWTILGTRDDTSWHAPQWVLEKCAAAGKPVTQINNGTSLWGLAMWEPCPRAEAVRFITQMFSRYRTDNRVKFAYATTFNAGEFWMPAAVYNDAKSKGLTPTILESYARAIIDAWVTALGVKKVVWTSAGGWSLPIDGPAAPDRANEYALTTLGTQLREGNAESVSANLLQPSIGHDRVPVVPTPLGAGGSEQHFYLTATQTIQQMGKEGVSFYGNEFEIADLAGVFDNYDYYRMAVLNMLRKGFNYALFPHDLRTGASDATHPQFAALRDYFRQSAGYPVNEAPDAWAALQMWYDGCFNGNRRYHNYERYLLQRDVEPDGRTVPADLKTWAPDHYGFCKVGEFGSTQPAVTYFARKTNHAGGSDYIYFDVVSEFAPPGENQFRIAVTYRDTGTAQWRLQYSTPSAALKDTPSVTNTGTNSLKTAIFTLSDASFRGAFTNGMDFRIYNGGGGDVTIRTVRVIRGGP